MKHAFSKYLWCLLFVNTTLFSTAINAAITTDEDVITTSSVRFHWDAVEGADRYVIWVGSAPNTKNYGKRASKTPTAAVHRLPTDGETLHTTVRARVNGRWKIVDEGASTAAHGHRLYWRHNSLGWFAPRTYLSTHIFNWRSAIAKGKTSYLLMAGTKQDPDAYARSLIRASKLRACPHTLGCDGSGTLSGLPLDGSTYWVTLAWRDDLGTWRWEQSVQVIAGSSRAIVSPEPGSQLNENTVSFKNIDISLTGVEKRRWRFGTTEKPSKYGTWPSQSWRYENTQTISSLPVDGSEIIAKFDIFDGRRWINVDTAHYTAARGMPYLWGDCTNTETLGVRAIPFKVEPNPDGEAERGIWQKYAPYNRGGFYDVLSREKNKLRDGCASDSNYILAGEPLPTPQMFISKREKGFYLWLNNGSGAAQVEISMDEIERSGHPRLYALPPNDGNPSPVFIPLPAHGWGYGYNMRFHPIDENKPVKISEIRMARKNDDVSMLPKLRFNGAPSYASNDRQFVAMSGDPRARVTAEIAERFGPQANSIGYQPSENCGSYRWVDATWMLDEGIRIINTGRFAHTREDPTQTTVWINWELVTNAEIVAAIEQSVNAGTTQTTFSCSPARTSDYTIDWLAKARSALNSTYEGPELFYEFEG